MCPRSSRVTLNVPPKYVPGLCVICTLVPNQNHFKQRKLPCAEWHASEFGKQSTGLL